ncbi:MAG TPA: EamA family transporter [Clostridiaceae bacterium]|nr:EamA family transporter [Clostridiaceae bacterium]
MIVNKFMDSIRKNYIGICIILAASLLTATGQLFWKISGGADLTLVAIGFLFYGVGAVLMIAAFRFGSLSVIHPMLSFSYIFALFFGRFILNEAISPLQLLGVFTIMAGVVLIGGGDA